MKPEKHSATTAIELMHRMMSDMKGGRFWPGSSLFDVEDENFPTLPSMKMPRVNMSETKKELKVEVEVPGCDAKDIEVSIQNDVLSIHAKKTQEKQKRDDKKHYYYHESSHHEFSRALPLPSHVDAKKAKSKAKNGVVTIVLPKIAGKEKGKKVSVKVQ